MRVDIDRIGKMWARYSVWLAAAAVFVGWPMNPAWGQFKGDVAALNANVVADSGEDTNLQLATDAEGNWTPALREAVLINHVDPYAKDCKM